MPLLDGPQTVQLIRAVAPSVRVLALTSLTDERSAAEMIKAGVVGFLAKDTPVAALVHAIHAAADGLTILSSSVAESALARLAGPGDRPDLSPVEAEVLRLVCAGHTNEEIGTPGLPVRVLGETPRHRADGPARSVQPGDARRPGSGTGPELRKH